MRLLWIIVLLLTESCQDAFITSTTVLPCPVESDPQSKTNSKSARFQSLMDEYKRKGIPGINLKVEDATGIFVGSAGMADIDKSIKLQPCHISKVASVTKMILATLTMKLQEEGVLKINDPLTKYLSSSDLKDIENADQVTLKDLMQHSTGIYDVILDQGFYLQVLNDPTKHWQPDELLKFVRGKKASFPANTSAEYSNTNYLLLGMALEKATGISHSQLLHSKIFTPLGLNDTYFFYHDPLPENKIAQGYFDLYKNGKIVNLSNWDTGSGNGYEGIFSTVMDMHRFMKALFVDKTILSDASLNQMLQFNETIVEARKYLGVGLFKDFIDIKPGLFAYGHRGRDLAYSADLFYFPQQKAIMALEVNYGNDTESDLKPIFIEFRDKLALLIAE
ncbi:MAG TPA: serine hydrolase [Cyclobacteriaceae bacterium]|nr:serine hydrolase [Cyclobacteriaceae bacterium]